MLRKVFAGISAVFAIGSWFLHETIKHLFFEYVVHSIKAVGPPAVQSAINFTSEYGVSLLFAGLCISLLRSRSDNPLNVSPSDAGGAPAATPTPSPEISIRGQGNSANQFGNLNAETIHLQIQREASEPPEREISDAQRARFVHAATPPVGSAYSVSMRLNDESNEGRAYLRKLLALFAATPGWSAHSQGEMGNTLEFFGGLHIEVGDLARVPTPVQILQHAFNDAGISFDIVRGPSGWQHSDFRIVIGSKP